MDAKDIKKADGRLSLAAERWCFGDVEWNAVVGLRCFVRRGGAGDRIRFADERRGRVDRPVFRAVNVDACTLCNTIADCYC